MRPKNAESIENVVAVIGKGEGMDNCVEVSNCQQDWKDSESREEKRKTLLLLREAIVQKLREKSTGGKYIDDGSKENGPREEHEVGPNVKHLRKV